MKPSFKNIITILILASEGGWFIFSTPPADYGEWAVRLGAVLFSLAALFGSVILLIFLNRKNPPAIFRSSTLCILSYSQIIYCGLMYRHGVVSDLSLLLFQGICGFLIWKYETTLKNKLIALSNLLYSSLWAISLGGHLYYWHISHDAETVGMVTAEKIMAVIFIIAVSAMTILIPRNQKANEANS